ncbi:MAG: acyl-CoA dehydrogenase family protein [Bacteroidota bacterium]
MTATIDTIINKEALKGGEFIICDANINSTFIPEAMNEDQQMIAGMVEDFLTQEIMPKVHEIEKQRDGVAVGLLQQAAELGLLGAHMPEDFGGMALDTNTNTIIAEKLGPSGAWTVTFAAHTGIGMLPILYFGTPEQKEKYLPKLIAGELNAAYCLTEPSSGSDALAAKTRADLNEAGTHYVLNGQKMWISNAGWADVFIVFAQIDGDKFTGFIVDRNLEGLTLGAEEDKLGIKGSSTRQVFFENVEVPADNVLGEIGKGHLIAFHVLNTGRFKLGALCLGGAKGSADTAIKYANERVQFKQPIANFGAIQYKLAEQAIRIFAGESALYRTSQLIQDKAQSLKAEGHTFGDAKQKAAEEYAIECAIMKIVGSEVLDYVVDETLQVHGGMGYSEEGTAARGYRDSRINRIYEGTNEINRMLMVDQVFKRALKGELDIVGPAWAVQKELASMPSFAAAEGEYGEEIKAVKNFKKIFLMVAGAAAKMQMDGQLNLKEEQEVLMNLANIMTDMFTAESLLMRVQKIREDNIGRVDQKVYDAMLKTFLHDATARMQKEATDALVSFAEGDLLKTFLIGLKRFTKYPPVNVKKMRRLIATTLTEANAYAV